MSRSYILGDVYHLLISCTLSHFGQEARPRRDASQSVPPTTKQGSEGASEEDAADVAKTENLVPEVKAEPSDEVISQSKDEDFEEYQRGEKDD